MKRRVYQCDLCGAKFQSEGAAWRHLDSCKKRKKHLPLSPEITTQEAPRLRTR